VADDDSSAMLERQVAYFSSNEFLRERADELRGASPAECWAATVELCATLEWFLDRMDPATRAHVMSPEPLSPELTGILETMQKVA